MAQYDPTKPGFPPSLTELSSDLTMATTNVTAAATALSAANTAVVAAINGGTNAAPSIASIAQTRRSLAAVAGGLRLIERELLRKAGLYVGSLVNNTDAEDHG